MSHPLLRTRFQAPSDRTGATLRLQLYTHTQCNRCCKGHVDHRLSTMTTPRPPVFSLDRLSDWCLKPLRRAENYRPRNQYRDRFFSADGTLTTIPGAIPKDQRLSPLPRDFYENSPLYEENDDDEQYGPLPEQRADEGEEKEEEEEEQAGRRKRNDRRSRRRRRRLDGDDTGEPAVEHPLTCVSEGDAVLFDISSGCYPLYEKDSLLNSNLE